MLYIEGDVPLFVRRAPALPQRRTRGDGHLSGKRHRLAGRIDWKCPLHLLSVKTHGRRGACGGGGGTTGKKRHGGQRREGGGRGLAGVLGRDICAC
ncbi:hypothetical protein EVAR_88147_1 [Eumeta japonica]|uniref:Uncharacterized protein n=1 Tax=Eumeta variegata TaxID=151549 RepID=A0A4C1WQJ8_EUMVA|nr:hypothetical protein EVAR_88147_1 [Eumeta japonica]